MVNETKMEHGDQPLPSEKRSYGNLSLRSELAQEIITRKPNFVEKWALLLTLTILLIPLASSWFIMYPDIIETKAVLTSKNAPKEIISRQAGHLVRLFVHNNEKVDSLQTIGWLESTASHAEVIDLSQKIDKCIEFLNQNKINQLPLVLGKGYNNLGEIQQSYQLFITAWQQFNDYTFNGFYSRKKDLLEKDIRSLSNTKQTIQSQRSLTEQDVKLSEETFNMNKKLSDERVITNEEFRQQKSKYVNKQLAIPQIDAALLANEVQSRDKLKEINQLTHDMAAQKQTFEQTLQSLKSQIDDWKKKYLLQSPVNGVVFFTVPLQENQFIQTGRLLGYINPSDNRFYAEANLAQNNLGKIDTGLTVQLRFDAYPYQEVGFVKAKLDYISGVPSDSGFYATIKLSNGLLTNNKKVIPYKNGLRAQALIITKNMRLIDRLYYNIVKSTSLSKK